MWENAEVVVLLDREGYVRAISRNEEEAPIQDVLGKRMLEMIHEDCQAAARQAMQSALAGVETEVLLTAYADAGYVFWSRVRFLQSPLEEISLLLHLRRLPRSWGRLSPREQEVINTLHEAHMNPKRAAKQLGITQNTLNAHRRSICQKCQLKGVGEFWVFVEQCR